MKTQYFDPNETINDDVMTVEQTVEINIPIEDEWDNIHGDLVLF
jgi:hypothetical protein